jgi:hypothetical protein
MLVEVLKKFDAGDRQLSPGDIVDGGGWLNLEKLIAIRYVRPAEERDFSKPAQKAMKDSRDAAPSSVKKRGRSRKPKTQTSFA